MEKRLLLAFVLSLGVFIGWGAFMAQFQPPPPVEQSDSAKIPKQPASTSQAPKTSRPVNPTDDSQPVDTSTPAVASPFVGNEKEIHVESGDIHYVFSNKGGVLKQILLPRFKNDAGDVINLINNPDHLTAALSLRSDDPEVTSVLQNAYYEPSITSIVLSEM
ncbi:MAG: membrane protein insertase YidC, partial [Nitrospina sp.]|nr:membrane protein insertase YidC [Nitrospina sp.]